MIKGILKGLSLGAIITFTGCATILNDENQSVNVTSSNGKPIEGTINGMHFKAPGPAFIARSQNGAIVITTTEGCTNQTVVESGLDPKFFGNIITGGLLGSTTDYTSEEMWKYDDTIVINCQ